MKRLAILGASGHGKVVADCAGSIGWDEVVFFDDEWPKLRANGVWSVIGNTNRLLNQLTAYDGVIVAIGENATRLKKYEDLLRHNAKLVSLVHPNALVSQYVKVGLGSVVLAGSIINVGSKIGVASIINTGATVDHDCILEDGVHVSPGAHLAGGVIVGCCAWLGIGTNVRQLINIGKHTIVGAGSVIVKDLPDSVTAFGNPAKIVK